MRVVVLARVPRWYGFRDDYFLRCLAAQEHVVESVVVEALPSVRALRDWSTKFGVRGLLQRAATKLFGRKDAGLDSSPKASDGLPHVNPKVVIVRSHNSSESIAAINRLRPCWS